MKRTISHEASAAAERLRELGFGPGFQFGVGGGAPDPHTLLGLGPQARWTEVKQAYAARLRVYHPEQHPQDFMRVVEAYNTLKRYYRTLPGADGLEVEEPTISAVKRRRADSAGCSLASAAAAAAAAPGFSGLQDSWQAAAAPKPVIALDPGGVGHMQGAAIGVGNSFSSGAAPGLLTSGFGNSSSSATGPFMPSFGNATSSAAAAPGPFSQGFGAGIGPFAAGFGNGQASSAAGPVGSAFGSDMGDDDDGVLTRTVSSHMGFGIVDRGENAMLIG